MERKPTAGTRTGFAASFHGGKQAPTNIDSAFKEAAKARSGALTVASSSFFTLIKNESRTLQKNIGCRRYTLGEIVSTAVA